MRGNKTESYLLARLSILFLLRQITGGLTSHSSHPFPCYPASLLLDCLFLILSLLPFRMAHSSAGRNIIRWIEFHCPWNGSQQQITARHDDDYERIGFVRFIDEPNDTIIRNFSLPPHFTASHPKLGCEFVGLNTSSALPVKLARFWRHLLSDFRAHFQTNSISFLQPFRGEKRSSLSTSYSSTLYTVEKVYFV